MTATEILALYDAEMRANPAPEPGICHERSAGVLCAVGFYNCILYSRLGAADADAAIADQVAYFAARGVDVEWKVYGHDLPPDLSRRLSKAGFVADESETLMAFDLAHALTAGASPAGVKIRRVADASALADFGAIVAATFNDTAIATIERYGPRLTDPSLGLYVAYTDGRPVAAARLEMCADRPFAGLWGGMTLPAYRRRGIFRALVGTRADEARRRGYRFLNVDARETSRPILVRLGFMALTSVTGWILKASRS